MFTIFFKLFKASINNNKALNILNVLGLSVGIFSSLLIYLWVVDEMSFDKFHTNARNIYRILKVDNTATGEMKSPLTPAPLALDLKKTYPQIIEAASVYNSKGSYSIVYNDNISKFNIAFTSNSFFDLFDFPVEYKAGDNLFLNEHSAVISSQCAKKIFGDENPIGEKVENTFFRETHEITAVVDIPKNSHIQFEILIPFETDKTINRIRQQWNVIDVFNYIRIDRNARFDDKQKLQLRNYLFEKTESTSKLHFQPLTDIHLFSDFNDEMTNNNGNIRYVRTFSTAAIFLLIIAGLNYIILSTARSEKRNKEVALKKLFGLNKFRLIGQFILETILITIIAQLIAIVLVIFTLPYFNEFTGKTIILQFNRTMLFYFIASVLIISLLAGAYLSFYLSSLKPISLLSDIHRKGSKYHMSTILAPLQLVISLIFIFCSVSIYQQLKYMQEKDKGMQLDNIIAVNTQGFIYDVEAIKNELLRNANIYSVTASGGPPVDYHFEKKGIDWEGKDNDDQFSFNVLIVDPSFLETFNIELLQGEFLPQDMNVDAHFDGKYHFNTPIIINETALSVLGFENPIGKKIDLGYPSMNGFIAGVVRDFNFKPLNYEVSPMAMVYDPESFLELFIKINPEKKGDLISYIDEITTPYRKGRYSFDYYFVKDKMDQLYKGEKNLSDFAYIFALISFSLSILGITGMISYSISRRRKGITIRKVFGAEVGNIIILYLKEAGIIVCVAFIIAAPVSWYYLQDWLRNYAYHIELSFLFFIEILILVSIVFLSISMILVYKEANKNPVENLHYE